MILDVKCPYCGERNNIKVEIEKIKGAIKGPYEQYCSSCGAYIDLLKLAILALGPTTEPPVPSAPESL
jgi:sarcosine oxidase delta subunit